METDAADIKNRNHHSPGSTHSPLLLFVHQTNVGTYFVFFPSTFQLVSFGLSNEMMVTFKDENLMTFRHLFLKGYKDHQMTSYTLYTKADVNDHIYYIINRVLTFKITS